MAKNESVRQFLDYYLCPATTTDFAVMLTGPWGSGKTHFIKGYLAGRSQAVEQAGQQASTEYLYASLYGVRSTSEISDQFFAQAHPGLTSKSARLLGNALTHLVNGDSVLNEDAVRYFKRYVGEVSSTGALEPDRGLFSGLGGAYAGLGYSKAGS